LCLYCVVISKTRRNIDNPTFVIALTVYSSSFITPKAAHDTKHTKIQSYSTRKNLKKRKERNNKRQITADRDKPYIQPEVPGEVRNIHDVSCLLSKRV